MASRSRPASADPLQTVRIDVWLDVACLFRTRSEAQRAVKGGKVEINAQRAKPHREVRPGDEIRITRPGGAQVVSVIGLAQNHLPKADARALYEDRTPPPTEEERAFQTLLRRAGRAPAPDKQQRRQLRRLKGRT